MAFTKVYWDTRRQDQTQTTYNPDDQSTVQQTIQTWIVISDSQTTTTIEAEAASDGTRTVPAVGAVYTIGGQTNFLCTQRVPKRLAESPFAFELQITFQRKFKQQPTNNPTKWATDIQIGGAKFTQDAYKDKDDKPIVNAAGQAFDPSVPRTFYDEAIVISYNTLAEESAAFAKLRGKVNSGPCNFTVKGMKRSFTSRQLLLDDATFSTSYFASDNTTPIWKATLTFVARQDTFVMHVLNQGYYELDGNGDRKAILGSDGAPISAPAPLDDNGKAQKAGATPVYKHFKIEYETDFTAAFAGL